MCRWTGLGSDRRLDPGSGPLAERRQGPAGNPDSGPRGPAGDECSDTAGTVCKFEQVAD